MLRLPKITTMFFPQLSHNALPNVSTSHLQYDQNYDIYNIKNEEKKCTFIYKDTINIIKILSYQLSVSILLHTYTTKWSLLLAMLEKN